jgi:hypothetical protein
VEAVRFVMVQFVPVISTHCQGISFLLLSLSLSDSARPYDTVS